MILSAGMSLDRYSLLRRIGHGAMGEVWHARHRHTDADCALKVLHSNLATNERIATLFVQEARLGARLGNHPNVVRVQDAGYDDTLGVAFLAMELLEGETLEERRRREGPLPWRLARRLFKQLGGAVQTAHDALVVHRDLKPGNLFLAKDGAGKAQLKVLDFGIARVLEEDRIRTATQIGTPAYAAPEQLGPTFRAMAERQGVVLAKDVSPATDIWALGITAYDLLTGADPGTFWGVDTVAELPVKIALEAAPRPSGRAVEPGALPVGFDDWFARCAARDVRERFGSFREAANALVALLGRGRETGSDRASDPVPKPAAKRPPAAPPNSTHLEVETFVPTGGKRHPVEAASMPEGRLAASSLAALEQHGPPPVPRTSPAAPEKPVAQRRGRTSLLVGAAVVVVGVGLAAMTRGGGSSATRGEVSATEPAPDRSEAPAPAAEREQNPWVPVAGARPDASGTLPLLGVPADDETSVGFRPSRHVTAPSEPYEIQQHEVTWGELKPWMDEDSSRQFILADWPQWLPRDAEEAALYPATGVPWQLARDYCVSLGGSLPTDEEWEWAARGPDLRPYPWGSERADPARTNAFRGPTGAPGRVMNPRWDQDRTSPVDQQSVFDLYGNAREWTINLYRDDENPSAEDWVQRGGVTYRSVRGCPPNATPPETGIPRVGAAYRQPLCATGDCPQETARILPFVGFRCVRHGGSRVRHHEGPTTER